MTGLHTKPRSRTPADQPVFVAGDGRRARRLRNAAIAVGVLAALWVVGLGIGMLGFGSLPGVGLVKGARVDSDLAEAPPAIAAEKAEGARHLIAAELTSSRDRSARAATAQRALSRVAAKRSRKPKRASRPRAVAPPPASAQTPANPVQRTWGWARNGYAAPRGQLRKAAPPPVTSRGRRVGHTAPATPPPAPAGQAKKALQPPPPPPPPKKG